MLNDIAKFKDVTSINGGSDIFYYNVSLAGLSCFSVG